MKMTRLLWLEGAAEGLPSGWIPWDRAIALCQGYRAEQRGGDVVLIGWVCAHSYNAWGYDEIERVIGLIRSFQLPDGAVCLDDGFVDIPF
jgi:hypothetical protein